MITLIFLHIFFCKTIYWNLYIFPIKTKAFVLTGDVVCLADLWVPNLLVAAAHFLSSKYNYRAWCNILTICRGTIGQYWSLCIPSPYDICGQFRLVGATRPMADNPSHEVDLVDGVVYPTQHVLERVDWTGWCTQYYWVWHTPCLRVSSWPLYEPHSVNNHHNTTSILPWSMTRRNTKTRCTTPHIRSSFSPST